MFFSIVPCADVTIQEYYERESSRSNASWTCPTSSVQVNISVSCKVFYEGNDTLSPSKVCCDVFIQEANKVSAEGPGISKDQVSILTVRNLEMTMGPQQLGRSMIRLVESAHTKRHLVGTYCKPEKTSMYDSAQAGEQQTGNWGVNHRNPILINWPTFTDWAYSI